MATISIEELTPGMELTSDLYGSNGRFLLPKGTEIEEKHLRILKIWGVNEVEVANLDSGAGHCEEDVSPELSAEAAMLMDRLFSLSNPESPPVAELRRVSLHNAVHHLQQGGSPLDIAPAVARQGGPSMDDLPQPAPECPKDLAEREVQLASFPDIYFQIREVLDNPASTASHVADVVSKDSSLSVKLLRLVNSPLYGFPSRVDSITRAVTLVGSNELSMLALGVSVVEYFEDVPPELLDMRNFWMHSIACGVFARILAGHLAGQSEERFFLGGLIHDVGRLVTLKNAPQCTAAALRKSLATPSLMHEAERDIFGFDHADVAARLMLLWQFPSSLAEMVAGHHAPMSAQEPLDAAIVHCADVFARSLWAGYRATFYVPRLQQEAWELLALSPNIIPPAYAHAEHMISDIYASFLGDA